MHDFPDHLHLRRIRDALWQNPDFGRASVMVGAGFSLNAIPISPNAPPFPKWSDLSERMVHALHPELGEERGRALGEAASTSGALRLAEEYQAAFGRDALETLLLNAIPDRSFKPSHLHSLLVRLPWSDVLTTNYDTLLERAAQQTSERRYHLIQTTADIPNSPRPRIVKLHGSFPATRPFIITEEDFRSFPRRFAAFTNLAQQIAMESVMCLVGFSGDDPNFLYWTGWVRDHLGHAAPQIYLCGLLHLNTAKRNLLQQRNVVPVDLSPLFPRVSGQSTHERHASALEWLLLNLGRGSPPLRLMWPRIKVSSSTPATRSLPELMDHHHVLTREEPVLPTSEEDVPEKSFQDATTIWKHNRLLYPGWLIAPSVSRDRVWRKTEYWLRACLQPNFKKLSTQTRFNFLFELNWRLERCLTPLFQPLEKEFENVLGETSPFEWISRSFDWAAVLPENRVAAADWADLAFARFRVAREDQDHAIYEKWLGVIRGLEIEVSTLRPKRIYEQALYALGQADAASAFRLLEGWPESVDDPFWSVRRAGLLAELGRVKEAQRLAGEALFELRSRSASLDADIYMLSREGWTLKQIEVLAYAAEFPSTSVPSFESRLELLARYKCDPTAEIDMIESQLDSPKPVRPRTVRERVSIFGKFSESYSFNNRISSALPAFNALRLLEEVGRPFRSNRLGISSALVKNACEWLATESPDVASANALRLGGAEALAKHFTPQRVALLSDESVAGYVERAQRSLTDGLARMQGVSAAEAGTLERYISQAETGLAIISKLLLRTSDQRLFEEYDRFFELYRNPMIHGSHELTTVFAEFMQSLAELLPPDQVAQKALELSELPIPGRDGWSVQPHFWPEPFAIFKIGFKSSQRAENPERWRSAVDGLIDLVASSQPDLRHRAVLRLALLHESKMLTTEERSRFAANLWSVVDPKSGFPTDTSLYDSAVIALPEPNEGAAKRAFKAKYLSLFLPDVVKKEKQADGKTRVTMEMSDKGKELNEIRRATKPILFNGGKRREYVSWTIAESLHIFAKIEDWWGAEGRVVAGDGSYKNNMWVRENPAFGRCASALRTMSVVLPFEKLKDRRPERKRILTVVSEILRSPVGLVRAMPLYTGLLPELRDEIIAAVRTAVSSHERDECSKGIDAAADWLIGTSRGLTPAPSADMALHLGHIVASRQRPALIHCLTALQHVVLRAEDQLSVELVANIATGLEYLLFETDPQQSKFDGENGEELLLARAASAHLSLLLSKRVSHSIFSRWVEAAKNDRLVTVRNSAVS